MPAPHLTVKPRWPEITSTEKRWRRRGGPAARSLGTLARRTCHLLDDAGTELIDPCTRTGMAPMPSPLGEIR